MKEFLILMVFLSIASYYDVKYKRIPDRVSYIFMAVGVILTMATGLIGLVAGVGTCFLMMVTFGWATGKEFMGGGDAKMMGAVGAIMGTAFCMNTLLLSLTAALVYLMEFKHSEDQTVQFAPFVAVSGIVVYALTAY